MERCPAGELRSHRKKGGYEDEWDAVGNQHERPYRSGGEQRSQDLQFAAEKGIDEHGRDEKAEGHQKGRRHARRGQPTDAPEPTDMAILAHCATVLRNRGSGKSPFSSWPG